MRVISVPQNIRSGPKASKTAAQMRMQAGERIGVLGVARLAGRLDRHVRILGERQQFRLEAIGGLAAAGARHAHVIDDQLQAGVTLGDPADFRQKHRRGERDRHPGALGFRPEPVQRPVGDPGFRMPLVEIEAQAEHAGTLLPVRDEIAPLRIVEIEPAHDREAIGIFPHRRLRQLVRIRVPQHRMDQRAIDAGFVHARNRLLGRIRKLAMMRRRRSFLPEMDLCIDNQHAASSFPRHCTQSRPRQARAMRRQALRSAGPNPSRT